MPTAPQLHQVAAEVQAARAGLASLLQNLTSLHQGAVWHSRAAEASRLRLHTSHTHTLEAADRQLAIVVIQIRQRAALLEATETGN